MRKISGIMIFLATAAGATAAETQTANPAATWTGFYTGISVGALFNESRLNAGHSNFINPTGTYNEHLSVTNVLPGVHAGYNHQLSSVWVLGAEADFTYPDGDSEFIRRDIGGIFDKFSFKNRLQGAIRTRVGYALKKFLPYAVAGASFADTSVRYDNEVGDVYNKDSVQVGWILGGGMEYAVYGNFSLRTEYLYTDYGQPLSMEMRNIAGVTDANGIANVDLVSHSVRTALNYRF